MHYYFQFLIQNNLKFIKIGQITIIVNSRWFQISKNDEIHLQLFFLQNFIIFINQNPWIPDSCSIYSHHRYWRHVSLPFYIFFLFFVLSSFFVCVLNSTKGCFCFCSCSSSAITHFTVHTLLFHSSVKFFSFFIRVLFFNSSTLQCSTSWLGKTLERFLNAKIAMLVKKVCFFVTFFQYPFLVFTVIWIWVFVYVCIWEIFVIWCFFTVYWSVKFDLYNGVF